MATGTGPTASRVSADAVIAWLRDYAATRIDSLLIDERRTIPPHVVLDFGNRGLLGLRIPVAEGGLGLDQADVVRVLEQLGAIDLTLATFVSSHAIGLSAIHRFGSPALRRETLAALASGREIAAFALSERAAGSNPRALETEARSDGRNGWILTGEKYLVDSGSWASVFTVFARTPDDSAGTSGISAFVIRQGTPGLTIGRESLTLGMRGMVQNLVRLSGVPVGPDALLGSAGDGIAISQDVISTARLNLAAKCVGGMKRCLQLLRRFASRRRIATGLLWDNPVTQSRVGQLVGAVGAVEALVARISRGVDAGEAIPTEAYLACKVAASESLCHAAETLMQAMGGRGYEEPNSVARILRDARSFLVSEGPTESLTMYVGSRAIHAGADLSRYISDSLGSPAISRRLADEVERIRAGCRERLAERIGETAASEWASWRAGRAATFAILQAAEEQGREGDRSVAGEWARSKFEQCVAESLEGGPAEWAVGQAAFAADLIDGYEGSIGTVEPVTPGVETQPDALLRVQTSGSPSDSEPSRLPAEERRLVLETWNETASPYPRDACVHRLFEEQAARVPDRVALVSGPVSLRYRDLDLRSEALARALRHAGVSAGAPVGVCVERSADLVVALLAVFKAGGAYVPLDTAQPQRRLAHVLEETRPTVIVASPELAARLPGHAARVVSPDSGKRSAAAAATPSGWKPAGAEGPAYVLFTSGSTGSPKGVEVSHRSVVNLLLSMRRRPGFSESDVLVAVTTLSFDISVLELFLPLVSGGRVVVADSSTVLDGIALARLMDESGATVLQATPATWQMLLASGWDGRPGLTALCGGEPLSPELAKELLPNTGSLWNMYGPTETTVWSCVERVTDGSGPISIGRPIANTRVYLLDDSREPVAIGAIGELWIGGDGVARGYWNRPDLTSERFVADPFRPADRVYRTGDLARFLPDGRIEHLGRVDRQIKIRGFRIEPGEIEAAIASHSSVREAVVEPQRHSESDTRLVAFVTLQPGHPEREPSASLRQHARDRLPPYMVPSRFIVLDRLPLTPNGKLDREALRTRAAPAEAADNADPPGIARELSPIESRIAAIWEGLLRLPGIGRPSDFFALGGHSLLATQVVSRLRSELGVEIPIDVVFDSPTLGALARVVEHALDAPAGGRADAASRPVPASAGTRESVLSSAQRRLWVLERLEPGSGRYNVVLALRMRGSLDPERLERAFAAVVRRHEILRTRFEDRDGDPVQVVDDAPNRTLLRMNTASLAEDERRAAWERAIQREASRPFDLQNGPLLRPTLLNFAPDDHVLLVGMHHIVTDGWSAGVLLAEVSAAYEAESPDRSESAAPLDPMLLQYADFARWENDRQRGPDFERDLAYWVRKLRELPPLDLPADRARPSAPSDRGGVFDLEIAAEVCGALRRLASARSGTMFMTLFAAWQALLSRYGGQEDFGIGFLVANRLHADLEGLIGCFVNTLVMRADLSGDPSFAVLLDRVRESALEAYVHQGVPFDRVVNELGGRRQVGRNPLFQVMFDYQNAPAFEHAFGGLESTLLAVPTMRVKFDLALTVREHEGGLVCRFDYSSDLFEAETIGRIATHFQALLEAVASDPGQLVADLPLVAANAVE